MNYWNEVERICERCQKSILNDYTINRYIKVPNFFRENHMLFCSCKKYYNMSDLIYKNDYFVINKKLK